MCCNSRMLGQCGGGSNFESTYTYSYTRIISDAAASTQAPNGDQDQITNTTMMLWYTSDDDTRDLYVSAGSTVGGKVSYPLTLEGKDESA